MRKRGLLPPPYIWRLWHYLHTPAPRYFRALPAAVLRAGLRKGTKNRQSRRPCCLLPVFLRLVALYHVSSLYPRVLVS